jgi:O-antigen ligase
MVLCILVSKGIATTKPTVALGVAAVAVLFIISFLSADLALYILIFSMLLGPEIVVGKLGGGSHLGRGLTLRLDDVLLVIIGSTWFIRSAIHKDLGLFLRTPLNVAILLYALSYVVSTGLAMMGGRVKFLTGLLFVFKYIEYFVIYFMVVNHVHSMKQAQKFVFCALLTCFVVSLYGIYQIPLGERVSAPFEGDTGEPNTFGGYLVFMLSISSALFLREQGSSFRWMLGILMLTSFIPFIYTLSRASYLAVIPMYVALLIFSEKKKTLLIALCVAVFVSTFIFPSVVKQRVVFTFTQRPQHGQMEIAGVKVDTSTSARLRAWKSSLNDFVKRPLFGYGVTGYGFVDAQFPRVLVESGLIGLMAFLNLLYRIFRLAHHRLKESTDPYSKGLIAGYLSGFIALIFHSIGANTFIIVRIMEPFWLFTAIIVVLSHVRSEVVSRRKEIVVDYP